MSSPALRGRIFRALRALSTRRIRATYRDALYRLRGASDGLPIPPARLHALVSGRSDLGVSDYFDVGILCAGILEDMLAADGLRLAEVESVLDFGCGCGRVLRQVHRRTEARLAGSDVNPEPIAWCRQNLPIADFQVNGLEPPLPFPDGSFAVVYAFSVFTHLPEPMQRPWIDELVRVLRPGGRLLFTTLGKVHEPSLSDSERRSLHRSGVLVRDPSFPGANRCLAYHTVDYVKQKLTAGLEVRRHEPGKLLDLRERVAGQDAYLVRKREIESPPSQSVGAV